MNSLAYLKYVVSILQPCLCSGRVAAYSEDNRGGFPSHGEPTTSVCWVANNVVRPVLQGEGRGVEGGEERYGGEGTEYADRMIV